MSSPARAQGKNARQISRRSMGIVCLGGKRGLVVMGPQSCVSAWKKSELPLGVGGGEGGMGWDGGTGSAAPPYLLPRLNLSKNKMGKSGGGQTFKLPNFPLKGVICIVNSPGSIHYPSAALAPLLLLNLLSHPYPHLLPPPVRPIRVPRFHSDCSFSHLPLTGTGRRRPCWGSTIRPLTGRP